MTSPFQTPPPRRGGGVFRALLLTLLVLGFGGSVLLNLGLIAGAVVGTGGGAEDPAVVAQVLAKGDPKQVVAVVELAGEIDGTAAARFARLVDRAERDPDVKVLVVEVDTPGGTVTASDEMHDRLLRYKKNRAAAGRGAGVVVAMRSMATSGGYYVACAADHLVAEPTTLTGNIGVLMTRFNVSRLMDKYGVAETTVVSSGADFKNAGSPFSPETAEGRAYLQGIADAAFGRFKAVVAAGRGTKVTAPPADVYNGKVFAAADALKLGLVDQVGFPADAYAHAAGPAMAALSSPHVVRYREPAPGLLGVMLGGGGAAARAPAGPPAAGVPADLRPESLDAWRTHRLLYR